MKFYETLFGTDGKMKHNTPLNKFSMSKLIIIIRIFNKGISYIVKPHATSDYILKIWLVHCYCLIHQQQISLFWKESIKMIHWSFVHCRLSLLCKEAAVHSYVYTEAEPLVYTKAPTTWLVHSWGCWDCSYSKLRAKKVQL